MSSQATLTDYDIQALVDNELGWEEEKLVRAYIESNHEARKRYDELMRQKSLLRKWWFSKKGAL